MSSLHAQYFKSRNNYDSIEGPDYFVTYKIENEELFIVDFFVAISSQGNGVGSYALDKIFNLAIENKCKVVSATIHLFDKNANKTLRMCLHKGFNILKANNDILLIYKEVGG